MFSNAPLQARAFTTALRGAAFRSMAFIALIVALWLSFDLV